MFTRLLVGLDGSPRADAALEQAVVLGERFHSSVLVAYVRKAGAEPGDTVLIGDFDDAVVFDWDPELPAGGGHAPGPRGSDWRLER